MCSESCLNTKNAKLIQCHGCKANFHMKCYGLSETLAQPLMENANLKFNCDRCSASNVNLSNVKVNVTALAENFKAFTTEFNAMKSSMIEMKSAVHNVNVNLPPSPWYQEMHDTLHHVKTTSENVATVVSEIRSTCDPSSNVNETNELLKSLLCAMNAMAPAAADNNKIIELLSDIRSATIATPKPMQRPTYSSITNNKRLRSPGSPTELGTVPRYKRASAIPGNGPATSALVVGGQRHRDNATNALVISPLHPRTSVAQIRSFIANRLSIDADSKDFSVVSLAPRGRSLDELSFISFKVSSVDVLYTQLFAADLWPTGISIHSFEERARNSNAVSLPLDPPIETPAIDITAQHHDASSTDFVVTERTNSSEQSA